MATTTTQTGDTTVQVSSDTPTIEQAQLLVQMQLVSAQGGADDGIRILFGRETPLTYDELLATYARDSQEYANVMSALGLGETIAAFVRLGLLSRRLVDEVFWIAGAWERSKSIALGVREEAGEPRLYEHFEWLAGQGT